MRFEDISNLRFSLWLPFFCRKKLRHFLQISPRFALRIDTLEAFDLKDKNSGESSSYSQEQLAWQMKLGKKWGDLWRRSTVQREGHFSFLVVWENMARRYCLMLFKKWVHSLQTMNFSGKLCQGLFVMFSFFPSGGKHSHQVFIPSYNVFVCLNLVLPYLTCKSYYLSSPSCLDARRNGSKGGKNRFVRG